MGSHCSQYTGGVLSHALCQSRWLSRACRGQKICKIFITSTFTYIPVFGFGNTRTNKFYWNFLLHRAWPQVVRCFGRLSQNHILISVSLFGGPALQLGSLQRNLYSCRIGLVPLQQLGFCFYPPGTFTTKGKKIIRRKAVRDLSLIHISEPTRPY